VSSHKPNKQRKSFFNAPIHVRRKRIRARLALKGDRYAGVRSTTVRAGDTVEILRGDHGNPSKGKRSDGDRRGRAGTSGVVVSVNSQNGTLSVDGVTVQKKDGKEVPYPVHASNVVIVKLDESDPLRLQRLSERAGGA